MEIKELNPTQRGILTLLNARDFEGNKGAPIPGITHLVKELFAIKMTPLGDRLLSDLEFEPDNYGPFDETISAALDDLSEAGFVSQKPTSKHVKISLTPKGEELADKLWEKLRTEVRGIFTSTKIHYNHLPTTELLDRIYCLYPEMTINSISKVAEKYR